MADETLDQKIKKLEAENRQLRQSLANLQCESMMNDISNTMSSIEREASYQRQAEIDSNANAWIVAGTGLGCLAIGVGLGLLFGSED